MRHAPRATTPSRLRSVAAAFAVGLTAALLACTAVCGVAPAGAGQPAAGRYWRLVSAPDGRLSVEHLQLDRYAKVPAGAEADERVNALDDPNEHAQWGLTVSDERAAWATSTGGGVTVAVVDSGVRATHVDLSGAVVPGTDFVQPGGDGTNDANGHGTHVAGIIAARANGVGGVGGAPSVRILPVRVLDAAGSGYMSDVASGVLYAADHGARVINLSLGGSAASPALEQALQYANTKGAVVVAAAGNGAQSGNVPIYPAAYPEAVAVAAVDSSLHWANFSQYGSYVDLAAPGVNILSDWSTSDSSYAYASGTSMAAPFVSASAAILAAHEPSFSAAQLVQRLEASTVDLGTPGWDPYYGHGLVDALAAVRGTVARNGYWVVGANGRVATKGGAHYYGDASAFWYGSPVVASAPTATGGGYWLATADGHVFSYGDAHFYGDMHSVRLNASIVAMARTVSGRGYWLLGADGGVFSFGDAHFYGSTGNMRLTAPVVDMTPTPSGHGYWFVATDGGVFSFGDAQFHGSTGNLHLWAPVASMTAASDGRGYWLVGRDGGIFAFDVPFHGSLALDGGAGTTSMRIRAVAGGLGYYILSDDGAVHSFGSAHNDGSADALGAPAVDLMTN